MKKETRGRKPSVKLKEDPEKRMVNLTITVPSKDVNLLEEEGLDRNQIWDTGFQETIKTKLPNHFLEKLDMTGLTWNKLEYRERTSAKQLRAGILDGTTLFQGNVWRLRKPIPETTSQINSSPESISALNTGFLQLVLDAETNNIPVAYTDIRNDFISGKKVNLSDYLKDWKMIRDLNGTPKSARWKNSIIDYPIFETAETLQRKKLEHQQREREANNENIAKVNEKVKKNKWVQEEMKKEFEKKYDNMKKLEDERLAETTPLKAELEKLKIKFDKESNPEKKLELKNKWAECFQKIQYLEPDFKV